MRRDTRVDAVIVRRTTCFGCALLLTIGMRGQSATPPGSALPAAPRATVVDLTPQPGYFTEPAIAKTRAVPPTVEVSLPMTGDCAKTAANKLKQRLFHGCEEAGLIDLLDHPCVG